MRQSYEFDFEDYYDFQLLDLQERLWLCNNNLVPDYWSDPLDNLDDIGDGY